MDPALVATVPSGWVDGFTALVLAGAVVPTLLSLLPDALALGVQRGRWRPLVLLLAANLAALACLSGVLSLATASLSPYRVAWGEFAGLLFGAGMVVALWHGIPRVMRSVLQRLATDRGRSVAVAAPAVPSPELLGVALAE